MTERTVHPLRAAGYIRVSTSRQVKGLSLDEQRRRVEEHVAREGWELSTVYEERGVSGRNVDRPELTRLLAERDRYDRLVVPKLDRLGRSSADVYMTVRELDEAGVALVLLDPPIDTTTPVGRLLFAVMAAVAEMESALNGERVRATAEARVARGRFYGSRRPLYGYGYPDEDGDSPTIPEQAAVVRRAFEEFIGGKPQRQIERDLIRDGIPAAAGGPWRPGTISKLLRRVEYTGLVVGPSGQTYPGKHAALVTRETFERAQEMLTANRKTGIRRATAAGHLLRGRMLRCAHCGNTVQARTEKGHGVYICSTRKLRGANACPLPTIRREHIEEPLLKYFQTAILDIDATRMQIGEAMNRKLTEVRALRQHAEDEAARADERLARVRRDYQDRKLDADDWREQREQLVQEQAAARAEADRLRDRQEQAEAEAAGLDTKEHLIEVLHHLRASIIQPIQDAKATDEQRAVLSRLYDRFILGRLDEPWKEGEPPDGIPFLVTDGGLILVPVPRPETIIGTEVVPVRLKDGIRTQVELPKLQKAPLAGENFATYSSQKTSRRPRRTTRSSS